MQKWQKRLLSWSVDLAVVAVVIWAVGSWQSRDLLATTDPMPPVSLQSLDGKLHTIAAGNGKKIVLYFFAPWCSICQVSSANIASVYQSSDKDEVEVYAIALAYDSREDVEKFAKEHGLEMPVLLGSEVTESAFKIKGFPTIYIVNEEGQIKSRMVGYTTGAGLKLRLL